METYLQLLRDTPVPTILVIAGIFFLFISILQKAGTSIVIKPGKEKFSVVTGIVLLVSGIGLYMVPPSSLNIPSATPTDSGLPVISASPPVAVTDDKGTIGRIKIVTQSPLSGDQSVFGISVKRGAELALEQLGNPLAQMGYQVELVPYDDQANPEVGVINAKQIVADQEVLCGVGHFNSGVMIPSSEEYHNARLPFVSPANTNPTVTDRGYLEVNRIVGRDDVQSMVAAEFANRHGINSIFVIHDNTVYGEGVSNRFIEQSVKLGIDVVEVVGTEEKSDFSLVSSSILAKSPDAVFFAGLYSQAGVFFRQVRDSGFTGIFLGTDGMDSSELATIAGDALVTGGGLFYTTVSGPPVIYPDAAAFINDFRAHYGSNPQPFAAQAYDAMAVCLKAIENSAVSKGGGLPTREEVAIAIRSLKDFKGITGIMNFNGNGDLTTARYFIIKVTSSDPARWYDNEIYQSFDISPP